MSHYDFRGNLQSIGFFFQSTLDAEYEKCVSLLDKPSGKCDLQTTTSPSILNSNLTMESTVAKLAKWK